MKNPDSYAVPGHYRQFIDQQTIDFIDRTVAFYPADTITASITRQREIYDGMCREFAVAPPSLVNWQDTAIAGTDASSNSNPVKLRCYSCVATNPATLLTQTEANNGNKAAETLLIYLHGGGFVVGGLESHHDVCAEFCQRSGLDVVAVDYRLSPEHSHPAALDDVLSVINHVAQSGKRMILCGDSAGGNLAAAASAACCQNARLNGVIAAQLLIYPGLGGDCLPHVVDEITAFQSNAVPREATSYTKHANAPMLTLQEVLFYREVRLPQGGIENPATSLASIAPLLADQFDGLPPTVCFGAQCDPLHDDGEWYCSAIVEAGGRAEFSSEAGLVHGYLRARNSVDRASDSFSRIVNALQQLAVG